jgi:wobble nucleotide-excising tRNase
MLERISDIQGIGLLHQANGKLYTCHKATLIYADNGRGKSTLATTFRSASTGNAALIFACKTIDGTLPPKAVLQFGSGHKVNFANGGWSENRPELLVFDAEFIGRNVHSGGAVDTVHRKNLLEFALGEAAVSARAEVEAATLAAKVATDQVKTKTDQLSGHHLGISLTQFEKLSLEANIDTKVAELQRRITDAGNAAAIQVRAVPQVVSEPLFDIDTLFVGLALSLADIHADAENTVKQHTSKLGGTDAESWLNQGQHFGDGISCPFCTQDITGNDLVRAYQTHFNTAYSDLKLKISALQKTVASGTIDSVIEGIAKEVEVAVTQAIAWNESVSIQAIYLDIATVRIAWAEFRELTLGLISQKQGAPAEAIGSAEDKAKAFVLWNQILAPIQTVNAAIKTVGGLIDIYKTQLGSENVPLLQQQISTLQAIKRRHDPPVVALLTQLADARTDVTYADSKKKAARENLDNLMTLTLNKYQTSINTLLRNFGASFSIKGMAANFRGNAPRSEYGLSLRGRDVALDGDSPSFATALSEGDKRTLAFAFFVASSMADPKLAERIIVIDDPVCSLDLNRRHHTRTVLRNIHAKTAQLIVLAHDPYFLRDLRDALKKDDSAAPIAMFQLAAAPNNYTDFASLDIDRECESDYARHHRLLTTFSTGNGGDRTTVAKAVRPMLEGYLHRRFPGLVPKGLMFGGVIVHIRNTVAPSPLFHAANLVDELTEINDYVGQFHHDTNPDADVTTISAPELKTFVDRALCVVHKGAPA